MRRIVSKVAALPLALMSLGQSALLFAQDKTVDVDVHTNGGTTSWVVSPLWIAIGVIGFLAIVAIIVAVSRGTSGASTTIVKD